jgi:hypothetical protein
MAAVELDIAAAKNRHDEIIDRSNSVHLFSDNWPVRRWASAWVAEQKTADPPDPFFEELESISDDDITARIAANPVETDLTGQAVRIGTVHRDDLGSADALAPFVAELAAVYAKAEHFIVPYLEVDG